MDDFERKREKLFERLEKKGIKPIKVKPASDKVRAEYSRKSWTDIFKQRSQLHIS